MREVPQGDGDTLSFGAYLKRSRALRELSAEQVARLTRLPLRWLLLSRLPWVCAHTLTSCEYVCLVSFTEAAKTSSRRCFPP